MSESAGRIAKLRGERPAYQALANDLREAIRSGAFPPEQRLPTEAELAAERGVSRQTVRHAYAQLVAESLVYRVRGRGSFASPFARTGPYVRSFGSVAELLALSVDTELEIVEPLERRADVDAAGRLQLPSDDVMVVTFRRLHEDVAFCVTTASLPVALGERVASVEFLCERGARSRETIIGLIESRGAVSIAGAHQSITAAPASHELARLLDTEPGTPLLRIDRVYVDHDGNRVELAVSYFNPMRYSYRLELRRT